jgi:cytochrome c oxidase subunit 2
MFVLTVMTVRDTDPVVPRDTELVAVGHQWWWEFRYPHSHVVTAYELHLPAGRNLSTRLQSSDVIHDFAVMQFGRKMDAIPGYWNYFWVGADRTGVFQGFCHEYCGAEHSWMLFKAIVQTPAEYDAWLRHQALPAASASTDQEQRGQELFQQKTCSNCHTIRGTLANGDIGPDLTHLASRAQLGSGIVDNTPRNLFNWLKNPQAIKPLVHMPNMQLSDSDVHALASYLENLK